MYFSNIGNEELQHFHHKLGVDFNITLTNLLLSDLFVTEEIIPDKLYRVFPMFYCNEVISSNNNDRVNPYCLILQKKDTETYLSFKTNNAPLIIDENYLNIKKITDELTMEEFNALVYRLRKQEKLTGAINFEETSIVNGNYGTYTINNADRLRNDTGFIINNDLKNNPLTIKLTNPYFSSAKYLLKFTVISITGANIYDDNPENFILKDNFEIELVENYDIEIPVASYVNDSVLLFTAEITIDFDAPEIVNRHFTLNLTPNKTFVNLNEDLILTATLTGEGEVDGYNIEFYEDNNLIGTVATSNDGTAVLNYSADIGNHIYTCKAIGLTANANVRVGKYATNITLNSTGTSLVYEDDFVLSGQLLLENNPLANTEVKLYNNNNFIVDLQTDNQGGFTRAFENVLPGNYAYKIVYPGTVENNSCEAVVNVSIRRIKTRISISTNIDTDNIHINDTVIVTGRLTDEFNRPVVNEEIRALYYHDPNGTWYLYDKRTRTDNNGNFEIEMLMNRPGSTDDDYRIPVNIGFWGTTIYRENVSLYMHWRVLPVRS